MHEGQPSQSTWRLGNQTCRMTCSSQHQIVLDLFGRHLSHCHGMMYPLQSHIQYLLRHLIAIYIIVILRVMFDCSGNTFWYMFNFLFANKQLQEDFFAHLFLCRDIDHGTLLSHLHNRQCLSHHHCIEGDHPQNSNSEGPGCPDCLMHWLRYLRGRGIGQRPHTRTMT